jgi:hypothetical protein
MFTQLPSWLARVVQALERLADRPWLLFAILLALNALARPYAGLYQDARLYSGQVLNQVEAGAYADDLFFRYGSQDQFSIFSRVMVPLVSILGLETAFFVTFLSCNGLFLWALIRLVRALVEDRAVAVLALVYLVVTPLPFGGLHVFYVHESFLTPRLAANALVLFALERILRQRYLPALALLGGALLLHPLMALGGVLVWGGCALLAYLRPSAVAGLAVLGVGLATVVLLYEPLGLALFGRLDAEWHDIVLAAGVYVFPLEWHLADWIDAFVSFAILLASAFWLYRADVQRRRFALVLVAVGVAGLLGSLFASLLPYALLLQGQPYRVLWLLKVVQAPLGFVLIARLSRSAHALPQTAALALMGFFSISTFLPAEFVLPVLLPPFLVLHIRGLSKTPRHADWLWRVGITTIVVSATAWTVCRWCLFALFLPALRPNLDLHQCVQLPIGQLGALGWLVLFALLVVLAERRGWLRPRLGWACLGFALALHATWFAIPCVDALRVAGTREGQDVVFMRDFLAGRQANSAERPTVYCALGRIDYVWVDLRSKSYFDNVQISGVLFNRKTAIEAQRRALMVRAFEIERFRDMEALVPEVYKLSIRRLFQADFDHPSPTVEDLGRLCQEPGLDYVLAKQDIAGLATADNGRLYVYDCRQVRAALKLPEPASAGAIAAR